MSKYYYHGIKPYVEHIESIKWLIKIIESDGIKSRRLTNQIPLYTGFNGADYISVCSKEEFNEYMKYPNNCFFKYIHSNYCFIISDEINAIKTNYFDLDNRFLDSFTISSGEKRYSDMFDEWQVKDEISINKIIGIGLPIDGIFKYGIDDEYKKQLIKLILLVREMGLDLVDTGSLYFIEEYEEEKNNKEYNNEKVYTKIINW